MPEGWVPDVPARPESCLPHARCYVLGRAVSTAAGPPVRARRRAGAEITATVGAVPYPPGMGDEPTTAPGPGPAVPGAPDEAPAAEEGPRPSLSPSRAGDFLTCPLLYRFRVIDRLPEAPSSVAARGTLVHAVLERLFDSPAQGRSPAAAAELIEPEWDKLVAGAPELGDLFADEAERVPWLAQAREMLDR